MKITRLFVTGFKQVREADVSIDGKNLVIGGANSSGKSSFLEAFISIVGGAKETCVRPIRDGHTKALMGFETDTGLRAVKGISAGSTTLNVTERGSPPVGKPQSFLARLTGGMAFDLSDFIRSNAAKQAETLAGLVGIDLKANAARRAELVQERVLTGRILKQLQGQLDGLPPVPADLPEQEVSVIDLMNRWDVAKDQARELENLKAEHAQLVSRHEGLIAQVTEWKDRLRQAEDLLLDANTALGNLEKQIENPPPMDDPDAIKAQVDQADETNQQIRGRETAKELHQKILTAEQQRTGVRDQIAGIDDGLQAAIAAAKMPVGGLALSEEGVLYNGIPFDQCGEAEKHIVAAAIGLKLIPEDGIRMLVMKHGSALDENMLTWLQNMVGSENAHLLIEVPRETGADVVFRDGRILDQKGEVDVTDNAHA